jgi:hypothetical protein
LREHIVSIKVYRKGKTILVIGKYCLGFDDFNLIVDRGTFKNVRFNNQIMQLGNKKRHED